MINLFEDLLRTVLAPVVTTEDHVQFVMPDAQWRTFVNDGTGIYLNVHLVDLRENRKLRSSDGVTPARLDCHYLISAWVKPEQLTDGVLAQSPTQKESLVLYLATRAILNQAPFVPSEIRPSDNADWAPFENHAIPVTVAPPEGFPKIAEFWGTVGLEPRWKPVVYVIATLPLVRPQPLVAPPVTTMNTDYELVPRMTAETLVLIAGTALVSNVATPGVAVSLTSGANAVGHAVSDARGRFRFKATAGAYRLQARAGARSTTRDIQVPSLSGEYDLAL